MTLSDPELVRREYASEAGLEARRSIYEDAEGDDAREVAFRAIADGRPTRVLEVGPGPGELSARIATERSAPGTVAGCTERRRVARQPESDAGPGGPRRRSWP